MIGRIFLMDYRTSWKSMLIFLIAMLFLLCTTVSVYPTMKTAWVEELEGAELVELTVLEDGSGDLELSWKTQEGVGIYVVNEDNSSFMTTPTNVYLGPGTGTSIPYDESEVQYFSILAVMNVSIEEYLDTISMANISQREPTVNEAVLNGTLQPFLIAMASTGEKDSSAEMLKSQVYDGYTGGGRVTSLADFRGFLSIMVFSLWFLPIGLYVGYKTASSITADFKEKRMDLIFSTPLSRQQYLLEKFASMAVYAVLFVLILTASIAATMVSIDMTDVVSVGTLFMVTIGSIPLFLAVIALATLSSVRFSSSKGGVGFVFLIVFGSTAIKQLAGIVESLDWMKYLSLEHYWDLTYMFYEKSFVAEDFIGMLVFSMIVMVGAGIMFKKKDIPV
jgi:ABC-type transport system involved in multi-copper enzyme maturation permease subunit